jgi:hypothetical protein
VGLGGGGMVCEQPTHQPKLRPNSKFCNDAFFQVFYATSISSLLVKFLFALSVKLVMLYV